MPAFDKAGNKMPLSPLAGPDAPHQAHVQRQPAGAVGLARAAKGIIHIAQHICQLKLRVASQKRSRLPFILLQHKGTGRINRSLRRGPALPAAWSRLLGAQCSALLYQRLAVLCQRCRFLRNIPSPEQGASTNIRVKKFRQSLF